MNQSNLLDAHERLVLDTGVAVNLLGTGEPHVVLQALNRDIVMDEHAINETVIEASQGGLGKPTITDLLHGELIRRTSLGSEEYELFLALAAAIPPEDLGDAEAATIATAIHQHAVPVIDDRKARRICTAQLTRFPVLDTVDLLAYPPLAKSLGREYLGQLVYNTLRNVRMRVPIHRRQWVQDLIGEERAKEFAGISGAMPNTL